MSSYQSAASALSDEARRRRMADLQREDGSLSSFTADRHHGDPAGESGSSLSADLGEYFLFRDIIPGGVVGVPPASKNTSLFYREEQDSIDSETDSEASEATPFTTGTGSILSDGGDWDSEGESIPPRQITITRRSPFPSYCWDSLWLRGHYWDLWTLAAQDMDRQLLTNEAQAMRGNAERIYKLGFLRDWTPNELHERLMCSVRTAGLGPGRGWMGLEASPRNWLNGWGTPSAHPQGPMGEVYITRGQELHSTQSSLGAYTLDLSRSITRGSWASDDLDDLSLEGFN